MASDIVPSRQEAGRSLAGLFYLILGRPEGLRLFDASPDGFWRSFGAFFWTWPVQCFLWTGLWRAMPETRPEGLGEILRFFFISTSFDVFAWVLPAILLLAVCQVFGLSGKFSRLVVVNNWFGLMSAYIGFFPAALRYLTPVSDTANAFISLAVYVAVIWLYFRVIRISLGGDLMISIFISLMMVMTGLTISELAFTALEN
ncbi:hypothetical protein IMCC20628_03767 [Hoeflea sp. IMCC20628]|uniref:hypothetical protein n=1 Tax=Hoeflea sp. IMCC20628 TaxID=1620421 RepID=UPI00063ABF28|nr:hypothetical protein [Hoeflea sp. IMCC20628]AKI02449.1 hypothetical protein IMCC20628_03767 [Hoeflea sp. IMCC20628]